MEEFDNHIRMSHDPRQTVKYEPDPKGNETAYEQANIRNVKLLTKCIEFCNTGQILQYEDEDEDDDGKFQLFRFFASSYDEASPPWPFKILIGENAQIWHAVG